MPRGDRPQVALGRLLQPVEQPIRVVDSETYSSLGVRWYAGGIFVRPAARGSDIKATRLFKVSAGDFIYNRLFGWKGSFALVEPEHDGCVVSGEFPTFRIHADRILPRYLQWYFSVPALWEAIGALSSGTSQTSRLRFKEQDFLRLQIPLPPIPEQHRIVRILDQADELRKLRAKADERTRDLIPAIFHRMFGDPATNPKGWPAGQIDDLGTVVTGNTPSTRLRGYFGDAIEWIKSDNINTPQHTLTRAELGLSASGMRVGRVVPAGSTLVTCIAGSAACIGNAALADRPVAFNQQINAIVPQEDFHHSFVYALILAVKPLIQAASTGGMKGIVSKQRFSAVPVFLPPLHLQADFATRFASVLAMQEQQAESRKKLDELFESLLHRAFAGEL